MLSWPESAVTTNEASEATERDNQRLRRGNEVRSGNEVVETIRRARTHYSVQGSTFNVEMR
jgi:hypothetical protein